jgi:arylsulfatase A-like enzyme
MTPRRIATMALLGALLAMLAVAGRRWAAGPHRPNVVVVLVDTLRADHLGAYGYERDTSPAIDAFGRDAVRFERAYSTSGWTRPATASLLTGLHPQRHAATTRSSSIAPNVPLIGDLARARGYHTAAFVTNVNVLAVWGFDRGFDTFVDVETTTGSDRADAVHGAVLEHLDADGFREPFLLYLHLLDPHSPYDAPAPFADRFRRKGTGPLVARAVHSLGLEEVVAAYDQEIAFVDRHFGALMAELQRRGWYDDALVVLTSDHGEGFGEHGHYFHGNSLFEELVRVPLLIKLPGNAHAGTVVAGAVSIADVAPTIATQVGAETAHEMDGVDLGETIERGAAGPRDVILDLDLLLSRGRRYVADGVVRGRFKLLRNSTPPGGSPLFDVEADPGERQDVAPAHEAVVSEMSATLDRLRAAAEGVHLWLVGTAEDGVQRLDALLTTDGRFDQVECVHGEEAAHYDVTDEGRTLRIAAEVSASDNDRGQLPKRLTAHDHVKFRLDSPDARVTLVRATHQGTALRARTGQKKTPARTPLVFTVAAPALAVEHLELLFPTNAAVSMAVEPGAYLGVVRAVERQLDEATKARLRALGYLGS